MKKVFVLVFCLVISSGCASLQKVITTGCSWMAEYISVADNAVVKIQQDYDTYAGVATGAIPAAATLVVAAKAWLGAADVALKTLGAVQKGICQEMTDIQLSLNTVNQSLPKLALPEQTLLQMRAKK